MKTILLNVSLNYCIIVKL